VTQAQSRRQVLASLQNGLVVENGPFFVGLAYVLLALPGRNRAGVLIPERRAILSATIVEAGRIACEASSELLLAKSFLQGVRPNRRDARMVLWSSLR
jgi:hypothetical protein